MFSNESVLNYSTCISIARDNFDRAIKNMHMNVMQALAYVLDETELLRRRRTPNQDVFLTIAIFKIAAEYGVELDLTDAYAQEIVHDLAEVCLKAPSAVDDEQYLEDLKFVKYRFL